MSFKILAYTTLLLHTAKKGLKLCAKKIILKKFHQCHFDEKGPPIDKNVNLQV
jgi:hypothetical protein